MTEASHLDPTNPYAASKAGAEYLVKVRCTACRLVCGVCVCACVCLCFCSCVPMQIRVIVKAVTARVLRAIRRTHAHSSCRRSSRAETTSTGRTRCASRARLFVYRVCVCVCAFVFLSCARPQYPEKLIPKFINQIIRGRQWCARRARCVSVREGGRRRRRSTLHGTGTNTRNFLFVEDVAEAFDCILHRGVVGACWVWCCWRRRRRCGGCCVSGAQSLLASARAGGIYNIGSKNELPNVDVARALLRMLDKLPKDVRASAHVRALVCVGGMGIDD